MNESLPISIKVSAELVDAFSQLSSITNKLEAQFNFQALTANWFGDEDNIIYITLFFEDADMFLRQIQQPHSGEKTIFADDVVAFADVSQHCIDCYIALTSAELELLQQTLKILPVYVQTKLQKVLNLIADKMNFQKLP